MGIAIDDVQLQGQGAYVATWAGLGSGEEGEAFSMANSADRSAQIVGEFSGASLYVEGSNDGSNWHTLRDFLGNLLVFTAADLKCVIEPTKWIRPKVVGGDGSTAISMILFARRN